jgi:hypothetical protein
MNSVFIEAKQWVDKTYGNSYFSARVFVDGEEIGRLPFQYGYGSQYEYEATKLLLEKGFISERVSPLWTLRYQGVAVYSTIKDANKQQVKMFGNSQI